MSPALHLLVVAFALYMLARHGRRALAFAFPGKVLLDGAEGEEPRTPLQHRAEGELDSLGFARLGARRERTLLGGLDLASQAYANETAGSYADVLDHAPARAGPLVYFLSVFPGGAAVLTANHSRPALSTREVQSGGLPGAGVAETFAAHRKALERFAARHGAPAAPARLAARQEAARAWYAGPGRREVRRICALNFLNAVVALALVAGSARVLVAPH